MNDYGEQIDETTIRFTRTLPGPIERVWSWITDGEKRSRWLGAGEMQLEPGGRVELIFNNANLSASDDQPPEKYKQYAGETRYVGEILEIDPPRRLKFTWPDGSDEVSEVLFELEARDDKVVLTLTQTKITDRDKKLGALAGWHVHFAIMAAKLKGETPPSFWKTHTRLEDAYAGRLS